MILYCLKYKKELCHAYIDTSKAKVKDQVWSGFGVQFKELQKKCPGCYDIVKVEIKEQS